MKTLKTCLVILCLLCVRTVGLPQYCGANSFMKEIKLTQGKVALVDDEDFEWINQWKWYAQKRNNGLTAARRDGKKIVSMHRVIMGVTDCNLFIDHKNHDILDNRRDNLRICTKAQNNCNIRSHRGSTSKYLGVCWCRRSRKWISSIKSNGIIYKLGYFKSEKEAAIAYNNKALKLHGEFANLNLVQ